GTNSLDVGPAPAVPVVSSADLRVFPGGAALQAGEAAEDPLHTVRHVPGEVRLEMFRKEKDGGAPRLSVNEAYGGWALSAYSLSPDRRTVAITSFAGFKLVRLGANGREVSITVQLLHRTIAWSPDSKRLAVWRPEGLSVAEVDDLFASPPHRFRTVHRAGRDRYPVGMTWAENDELLVLQHRDEPGSKTTSEILRVRVEGGAARPVVESEEEILWFLRHRRHGRLAAILYATRSGLSAVDERRHSLGKIAFEMGEVANAALAPDGTEVAFIASYGARTAAFVARFGRAVDDSLELLGATDSSGALAYSPSGHYLAWTSAAKVVVRPVKEPLRSAETTALDLGGEIGNIAWHRDERRLAVAVGGVVCVLDVERRTHELLANVASGREESFVAEPVWAGEDLLFSVFSDIGRRRRR
ncbi:MAG: hypothetical protein ACAI25_10680, partial [Planctomycetota bacterium]